MIYVFLADGFEDMEAIVSIDILKRTGMEVKTVGLTETSAVSASGIKMSTDITVDQVDKTNINTIVLPGGMPGTLNLLRSKEVLDIITHCASENILIGAICAAPMILGRIGLLKNKSACCFPGFEKYLDGAVLSSERVCVDGNIVTAKGPGVAMEFAFKLVEVLCGKDVEINCRKEMQ